jgi:predicted nucleic acid-binding protein
MGKRETEPDRAYWDACVFVSILADFKDRTPEEIEGLRDTVARVEGGELIVFTSHLWEAEVLQSRAVSDAARERIAKLFQRRRCQLLFTDPKVISLANSLREFYGGKLAAFDSIHLATAIHYRIPVLHTYDAGKKGGISLLLLSGKVADRYTLTICKPPKSSGTGWLF